MHVSFFPIHTGYLGAIETKSMRAKVNQSDINLTPIFLTECKQNYQIFQILQILSWIHHFCNMSSNLLVVSACIPGKWGSDCDQDCPAGCADDDCDSTTGDCDQCVVGKYGATCDEDWPSGCDGACGRTTDKCDSCSSGWYGDECDQQCGDNCTTCTQSIGCKECKQGYYGDACKA